MNQQIIHVMVRFTSKWTIHEQQKPIDLISEFGCGSSTNISTYFIWLAIHELGPVNGLNSMAVQLGPGDFFGVMIEEIMWGNMNCKSWKCYETCLGIINERVYLV